MARTIDLAWSGATVKVSLDKVDRSSLYGSIDTETRDLDGRPCRLATLAGDGATLIMSGDTALANLSPDGRWLERSELVATDISGKRLNTVASSFAQPLELEQTVKPERFLDHSVRSAYMLTPVEAPLPAGLLARLGEGTIFKTDFSWRGGVNADPAFVMQGADGTLWLLVAADNEIDWVGFAQTAGLAADEDGGEEEDELDFDMM